MRYYIYILVAVLLTAITFCIGKKYQVKVGTMRIASAFYNLLTGAFTFVIFWIANGALISITPFSLFIATVVSICGIAYSFIGFKLMAYGKYSVYVMYLMVGGMALPFLYGWIVLGEPISPIRVIGLLLLTVLLILLNQKPTEKAKCSPWVYRLLCVAVFLLNGAVSVFLKMHQVNTAYETLPTIPYNILSAMMGIACSGVWVFAELIRSQRNATTDAGLLPKDMCCRIASMLPWILLSSAAGATSSFLMLHSASHVDASVLYPMVTGGTVVLSALAGYVVFGEKQTKKDTVLYILCLIATLFFVEPR